MMNNATYDWIGMGTPDAILEPDAPGTGFSLADWKFGTRVQQWWERLLHRPLRPVFLDPSERKLGILLGTATRGTDTSLLRLATNAARHSWKVIQFDSLGSHARAATFLAAMQQAGLQDIRAFPHEPYNGWQAAPELLQQHLLQGMPFYRGPHQQYLAALCLAAIFAHKPVAGLKDLLQRLNDLPQERWSWKSQRTATPLAQILQEVPRQELVDLAGRFGVFATLLGSSMDGKWTLGQVDAAHLSFDAITHPLRARTQATLLLADLVRYLTDAGRAKERVLLLLQHPEMLFDLEEQLVPFLSSIERLGVSVILAVRTPKDLGAAADHILSLAHTVVMHHSPTWWTDLPSALTMPGGRIPPMHTLAQLPHDECLVFQSGSVSHVRVDPVKVPAGTLHHASTSLYAQEALIGRGWGKQPWSPFDSIFEIPGSAEVLFSNSLWSPAWSSRPRLQGWTLEIKDLPFPNDLSKAFSMQSDTSKTGEQKRKRQRGKRGTGGKNNTYTHDSSSAQGDTHQNLGDEDLLT